MAKSVARRASKRPDVNTEDAVMENVGRFATWASENRSTVAFLTIGLAALIAGGIYYQTYQASVTEAGAVQLAQLRLSAPVSDPNVQRESLVTFVSQYGGTPSGNQGRLMLAELELQRDSVDAAISVLEDVVAKADRSPTYYSAVQMLAAAHEQRGNTAEALRLYDELEEEARFDYLRTIAGTAKGRLLAADGRLEEAAAVYERLIAAGGEDVTANAYARVRLGELQARIASGQTGSDEDVPAPSSETPVSSSE